MTDAPAQDVQNRMRALPAVHELVDRLDVSSVGREVGTSAARATIELTRQSILAGSNAPTDLDSLTMLAQRTLDQASSPPLRPVINATGILIHTGLGRSPMSERAGDAIRAVACGAAPVELDVASGKRGKRADVVRDLLIELTGAEAGTVVNNCAAALLITLSTIAQGKRVLVSRSELVEIGGSFRLPDVIENGGARLREVGTTNRVRIGDFERAIDDQTAAILRVHASNYRIEGFTEQTDLADLVSLGREHDLPVIHDIGSGLLRPSTLSVLASEPDARTSIGAGADLVLFSGDKLLGGPQAGIIVGAHELVERIERNPLMRALRVDKLTLAGLGVTLQLHRDGELASRDIPAIHAMNRSVEELQTRADALAGRVDDLDGVSSAEAIPTTAYVGGGSNPAEAIDSVGIAVRAASIGEDELARRLRTGEPGVFGRIEQGRVVLDLRAMNAPDEDALVERLKTVV